MFTLVGVVVTTVLTQLSHQFAWWPLHPLGFVVPSSFTMYGIYLAFLIAWVAKLVVLRWGGVKTYRNCMPFFIGLMVGHYAGRAISLTVSMLSERALA